MHSHKLSTRILTCAFILVVLLLGFDQVLAAKKETPPGQPKTRLTQAERQAAADRAAKAGFSPLQVEESEFVTQKSTARALSGPTISAAKAMALPGAAPRYFSHPNYANSPWPTVNGQVVSVGNPLVARQYATDFATPPGILAPVLVILPTPLPAGFVQSFQIFNQATSGGSPTPSEGNIFHAYILRPTGIANQYDVVFDSGLFTVPPPTDPTVGNVEIFAVQDIAVNAGDVIAFYGEGIPVDVGAGNDILSTPTTAQPIQNTSLTLGGAEFPIYNQARTYSFAAQVLDMSSATAVISGGIRKFVDTLPGLGASAANNLGQFIPVAVPDTTTFPGSDYYEFAVREYTEKMHSDLPPTTLRGYVQLNNGTDTSGNNTVAPGPIHYLGPMISATKGRPVRILFHNQLPVGAGGNLIIPVDTTVMGAGRGPELSMMPENDPQNPVCDDINKPGGCYTENRAVIHLHGGTSPWISDGTPHQWIIPGDEDLQYLYREGASVRNVPDMFFDANGNLIPGATSGSNDPGPGSMTYYYTNQQSARLLFYHDHAWGITRLNVYAGMAAPYLITDDTERSLVTQGIIPADQIPLVIQDKTFVPEEAQLSTQDETWDMFRWGGFGSLWLPHVYSPAQNPGDASGVNQFGRWAYGPWFWPPTTAIEYGPVANPYYDPLCDPDTQWCEPPEMPGTPWNSMGMEAFMDTPVVNGTVYPTVTLEAKPYRFRVLNAANDRFFNLSLYKADPTAATEVQLNPAEVAAALADPTVFPTPVAGTEGPSWIQIGTEGGFLPAPVVIPPQPTTWVNDPTVFNAGNVDQHSLLLGPAERADVIVDFSAFAGQTLILYNDAPAAFPARDPRYDYYTGNGDYRDTGGAPSTLPGYGPNTRTVMQIKVAAAPVAPAFDLPALQTAFKATSLGGQGVFANSQHPIIVGQGAYNSAYGTTFQSNGPLAGLVQIFNTSLTFKTLLNYNTTETMTMPLMPKQIQDEMGEAFDPQYGRMSGFLGLETPNAQAGAQNMLLYGFESPPTELFDTRLLPKATATVTPISSAADGSQIWKITHNGVDTHPIHFHLYDVQVLNRVGWDGIIRKPDPNELGWKDTVRISPLEDTIVAIRPIIPELPWEVTNSIRLLNPAMPEGALLATGIQSFDPAGLPVDVVNHYVNFGWEYVWHCHILSHEEMDMMRNQVFGAPPKDPSGLAAAVAGSGATQRIDLSWSDNSINETAYTIQRATANTGPWTNLAVVPATVTGPTMGTMTYSDVIGNISQTYYYQVQANNVVGDTWDYQNGGVGFPNKSIDSAVSNIASATGIVASLTPAAPSNVVATILLQTTNARFILNWTDNATNETGFTIQRSTNATFTAGLATASVGANITTWTSPNLSLNTNYYFRVRANNAAGTSAWVNAAPFPVRAVQTIPVAPSNVVATSVITNNVPRFRLNWTDNSTNETGFTIQRASNAAFTTGLSTSNVGANVITWLSGNLALNTDYYFRIRANNSAGSSAWVNATPLPIRAVSAQAAAPSNVVATSARVGTAARVTLNWTDNANNETGFLIVRSTSPTFPAGASTTGTTVGANITTWTSPNLSRNTNYYFRIRANSGAGNSAWVNATPFPIRTP